MKLIITAAVSIAVLVWLILLSVIKFQFLRKENRKYIIATTAVYLSGTVLILILSALMDKVPMSFCVISEASILSVYIISFVTIMSITRHIGEIMKEVEKGKIKGEMENGEAEEGD